MASAFLFLSLPLVVGGTVDATGLKKLCDNIVVIVVVKM
jgi:hypothetical protein